jgi:hypothetical protein
MRPILLISLAITVVGCARAQGTGKSQTNAEIEEEVLKVEHEKDQAMQKGDASTLDRIYGGKLSFVNPRGQVLSSAQRLADVRPGNLDYGETVPPVRYHAREPCIAGRRSTAGWKSARRRGCGRWRRRTGS